MSVNVLGRMDIWLLFRVFMRLSHWVDWRFHRNQYDLAAWMMSAGIAMNLATAAQAIINNWKFGLLNALSSAMLGYAYVGYLGRLQRASAAYERNPDRVPQDALIFIFMAGFMRLGILFIGSWLCILMGNYILDSLAPFPYIGGVSRASGFQGQS